MREIKTMLYVVRSELEFLRCVWRDLSAKSKENPEGWRCLNNPSGDGKSWGKGGLKIISPCWGAMDIF